MYVFDMPLYLITAKSGNGKKYRLNMNEYRNWKGVVSNTVKIKYKEVVSSQLKGLKLKAPIQITFVLYKSSKRRTDRANQCCIHEKFFCDALVELGCLEDDNDNYIVRSIYETGGIDRENPRMDIIIEELDNE